MADIETTTPEANYASRSNIVVPAGAGVNAPANVAARAKADIEARIGEDGHLPAAPLSGKTLSAVSSPRQES